MITAYSTILLISRPAQTLAVELGERAGITMAGLVETSHSPKLAGTRNHCDSIQISDDAEHRTGDQLPLRAIPVFCQSSIQRIFSH